MLDDTIAAIATPLGEGGLSVLRISGSRALTLADRCFSPRGRSSCKPSEAVTHSVHYGWVMRDGHALDEVLLTVLRAPRTFTREDVVEISCHGGVLPAKLILDTLLQAGARLAEPGEFTRRAFLNGRLDLAQAEAVADIIHSRTELSLEAAQAQLQGKLSEQIHRVRDDLLSTLAHVEAHIDFPDEDIAPDTRDTLLARLTFAIDVLDRLLRHSGEGQILRRGIRVVIFGRPNAGKSSLLNQLLGRDRAIVSSIAGTTRDTIEEVANLRGLPVVLIDTAGLREVTEEIEREGVRRSQKSLAQAELLLHVLDRSVPLTSEDQHQLDEHSGAKRILVWNKSDLPRVASTAGGLEVEIEVSCTTGEGIEALKDAIKQKAWAGEIGSEMLEVMINSRHQNALLRARESVDLARIALRNNATLELVAVDLRIGVNAVGEIVGKTTTEDLLDSIFSQFCIGK